MLPLSFPVSAQQQCLICQNSRSTQVHSVHCVHSVVVSVLMEVYELRHSYGVQTGWKYRSNKLSYIISLTQGD